MVSSRNVAPSAPDCCSDRPSARRRRTAPSPVATASASRSTSRPSRLRARVVTRSIASARSTAAVGSLVRARPNAPIRFSISGASTAYALALGTSSSAPLSRTSAWAHATCRASTLSRSTRCSAESSRTISYKLMRPPRTRTSERSVRRTRRCRTAPATRTTASAAAMVKPPEKTPHCESTSRSSRSSDPHDHSTDRRSVAWRAGTPRRVATR